MVRKIQISWDTACPFDLRHATELRDYWTSSTRTTRRNVASVNILASEERFPDGYHLTSSTLAVLQAFGTLVLSKMRSLLELGHGMTGSRPADLPPFLLCCCTLFVLFSLRSCFPSSIACGVSSQPEYPSASSLSATDINCFLVRKV